MSKRITLLLLIVVCAVFAGCGKKNIEEVKTSEEIIADLRDSTVMIYAGELHGSGVVIGNDGDIITIATVSHLMKDMEQGIVIFNSDKTGFANVVYNDELSDVCLMTMNVSDFYEDEGGKIKAAELGEDRLETMNQHDKVLLLGSAVNVGVNATYGEIGSTDYYVFDYDNNMIYLYADAMSGMSGSGCYTEDGLLIGILSAGSENSEVLCIKINDYIKAWNNLSE